MTPFHRDEKVLRREPRGGGGRGAKTDISIISCIDKSVNRTTGRMGGVTTVAGQK